MSVVGNKAVANASASSSDGRAFASVHGGGMFSSYGTNASVEQSNVTGNQAVASASSSVDGSASAYARGGGMFSAGDTNASMEQCNVTGSQLISNNL